MDTINYRVNWENVSVANVKMDFEDDRISPDVQMIAIFCASCEDYEIKRWCL